MTAKPEFSSFSKPKINTTFIGGNEGEDEKEEIRVGIPDKNGMVSYGNTRKLGSEGQEQPTPAGAVKTHHGLPPRVK